MRQLLRPKFGEKYVMRPFSWDTQRGGNHWQRKNTQHQQSRKSPIDIQSPVNGFFLWVREWVEAGVAIPVDCKNTKYQK